MLKNDFVLMGFGEHTSAIGFASGEPETTLRGAQFSPYAEFLLVVFQAAWFLLVTCPACLTEWIERHKPSPFK